MYCTGVIIIAAVVLQIVIAQQRPSNISIIEKFFYERCRRYSTDAAVYDDIKTHFGQLSDYLTFASSLLPNGKEQFCNDEKPKLIGLAKSLASESIKCMAKDEKYLPKFMYESFTNFIVFACDGRNIESFFGSQGADCRATMKTNHAGEEVGNCFKKFFARFNDIVKKDDLCLDIKSAKRCFRETLNRHCEDFAAYISLNNRFFDAVMKPCTNNASPKVFSFSTVILLGTLFTKFF